MFQAHGVDNCKIELLENFPCENKKMLEAREGWYMDEYDCVNGNKAGRTRAQYRIDNNESIKAYEVQYYKDNKESIKIKKTEYDIKNRKELNAYANQYHKDNKDKIKLQNNQKNNCQCGGQYTYVNKIKHIKTKKHQEYIKIL
jgi:hypothetical protein